MASSNAIKEKLNLKVIILTFASIMAIERIKMSAFQK